MLSDISRSRASCCLRQLYIKAGQHLRWIRPFFLYSPDIRLIGFQQIFSNRVIDVLTFILTKIPRKNTLSTKYFIAWKIILYFGTGRARAWALFPLRTVRDVSLIRLKAFQKTAFCWAPAVGEENEVSHVRKRRNGTRGRARVVCV